MTKIEFLFHLQGASFQALKFAENYVKTELKTNFKYNVIFGFLSKVLAFIKGVFPMRSKILCDIK